MMQPRRDGSVAVINTLGWHYECMGQVLEYLRDHGITVDVYMEHCADGGWAEMHARLGLMRHALPISSFRGGYEHVFAMNGVDLDVVPDATPATCIAHTAACRVPRARQIHLRPIPLSMSDWVVPVYRMCTAEQKTAALSSRTSIALIGNSWAYSSAAQLRALFAEFDSTDFHVVNRAMSREIGSEPNVALYENAGTDEMMRVVMKAHYVAAPFGGVFDESQLSGCVALAFSTGTPLIISARQNAHLLFDSAVVVHGAVVPPLEQATPASVRRVIAERDRLCRHRDSVYNGILTDAIPKVRFCTAPFKRTALPFAVSSILQAERERSPDYEVRYFDDASRDAFVRCHFPQFMSHYRSLPWEHQAGLWSLMLMYTHGGVYADIAARFAMPLASFIRSTDQLLLCVDTQAPAGISGGFIAARPAHPAVRLAIESVVQAPQAMASAVRLFMYGVDDGRALVPGDYGTHRLFEYRAPEMRADAVVVSTFRVDGYSGDGYSGDLRGESLGDGSSAWATDDELGVEVRRTLGFIILRHVISELTGRYWVLCYDSIRRVYPDEPILIIDDNSDPAYIRTHATTNTTLVQSEYPKRGDLLPYLYYLTHKISDRVIILNDSAFITRAVPFCEERPYQHLWDFEHDWDQEQDEASMVGALDTDGGLPSSLRALHAEKARWKGCFGSMTAITHAYLREVDARYGIAKLTGLVTSRLHRTSFQRVLACLLRSMCDCAPPSVYGDIHEYCPWGIPFDEGILRYAHLPVIRVWTGR